jgi:hypothetical protein
MPVVVIAMSGCVSVDATRIRKGVYVVNVRGNAIGGQGEAITAAHERASQLCPDGYEIEDSAAGSTSAYLRTTYGYQQIRKPEITIVVRCDQEEPPPRPAPPSIAATPIARWWCFEQLDGRLGMCDRNPTQCEIWHSTSARTDPGVSPCAPRALAYCFGVSYVGQAGSGDMCHPTPDACANQRSFVVEHPEQGSALTECRQID